ncbi:hypothetical protein BCR42DRAFT_146153 [Absidia repens]|uniref:Uncharacterized protein n=1 Tax=Absidia repens TaxID=90262 RepID=A0A1X2I2L7_9FUNG|nr:hypothetical protein BCR42DRAFT_146153 [Absidia repens]
MKMMLAVWDLKKPLTRQLLIIVPIREMFLIVTQTRSDWLTFDDETTSTSSPFTFGLSSTTTTTATLSSNKSTNASYASSSLSTTTATTATAITRVPLWSASSTATTATSTTTTSTTTAIPPSSTI